jgi:imidazolonepropionase-like amidohydrolase
MRIRRLFVLAACLTHGAGAGQMPPPQAPVLIKAGRLLDVRTGVYRTDQGILVARERIRQVGAFEAVRAAAPADAVVIDLGRFAVLPGLIDCHAHLLDADRTMALRTI